MQNYTILLSMQHNNTDLCYIHIYAKNIDTGSYQSDKNVMWEKENVLPTVYVHLFVAKKRKQTRLQEEM